MTKEQILPFGHYKYLLLGKDKEVLAEKDLDYFEESEHRYVAATLEKIATVERCALKYPDGTVVSFYSGYTPFAVPSVISTHLGCFTLTHNKLNEIDVSGVKL